MIQDTMLSVSVVFGQEWSAAPVVTSKVSRAAGNFYSRNLDERVREQLAIWANTENTACLRNAPPHCSASASITQRRGLCPVWLVLFCCSVLFPPGSLLVPSWFPPSFYTSLLSSWHQNGAQLVPDVNRKSTTSGPCYWPARSVYNKRKLQLVGLVCPCDLCVLVEAVEF